MVSSLVFSRIHRMLCYSHSLPYCTRDSLDRADCEYGGLGFLPTLVVFFYVPPSKRRDGVDEADEIWLWTKSYDTSG